MADLTAKKREKLPAKDFGLPEKARTKDAKKESGNYPMPDKAHARNAKARAAQQQKAGNLTKKEQGAHRPQGRQDHRRLRLRRPRPGQCACVTDRRRQRMRSGRTRGPRI